MRSPGINKLLFQEFDQVQSPKIFCVGLNKTGTTSLQKALIDISIKVGNQRKGERLLDAYVKRNFRPIIQFCKSAQAFQDFPFSAPLTYKYLSQAYPNSKFILSIRDSDEQWYDSLVRFHTRIYSATAAPPTRNDLQRSTYVEKGWSWRAFNALFAPPDPNNLYDRNHLLSFYNHYNDEVQHFFASDQERLLVLNLATPDAYGQFCRFIGKEPIYSDFPWRNKTTDLT